MTPTQRDVTEEQYNNGSSAKCRCGAKNYFLVPLTSVSYQWICWACGEDNFHPCHQQARNKLEDLRNQLQKLQNATSLSIIISDDGPEHNHQFTRTPTTSV